LVQATGLQPGSLYAAFKNKKGILIEALKKYSDDRIQHVKEIFELAPNPSAGIRKYVSETAESCHGEDSEFGCFMVNNLLEMAPYDNEVTLILSELFSQVETCIAEQVTKAQETGELNSNMNASGLAKFIMTSMWGVRVFSKTKPTQEEIQMVVDQISLVLDASSN